MKHVWRVIISSCVWFGTSLRLSLLIFNHIPFSGGARHEHACYTDLVLEGKTFRHGKYGICSLYISTDLCFHMPTYLCIYYYCLPPTCSVPPCCIPFPLPAYPSFSLSLSLLPFFVLFVNMALACVVRAFWCRRSLVGDFWFVGGVLFSLPFVHFFLIGCSFHLTFALVSRWTVPSVVLPVCLIPTFYAFLHTLFFFHLPPHYYYSLLTLFPILTPYLPTTYLSPTHIFVYFTTFLLHYFPKPFSLCVSAFLIDGAIPFVQDRCYGHF